MRRLITIAAAAALLAAPTAAEAAATAETRLPVGAADGVRLVQRQGRGTFLFGSGATRLWKAIAGKRVELSCTTQTGVAGLDETSSGVDVRTPRRGRAVSGAPTYKADFCSIGLPTETARMLSIDTVVTIPLTQKGANLLDERDRGGELFGLLMIAGSISEEGRAPRYATVEQITRGKAARFIREQLRLRVVALAAPTDTPPAGTYGYWSDGGERAAVVTTSAAGRRLYAEMGPDQELRTNIVGALFADD